MAALHLVETDAEATMLVLPADHLIDDEVAFQEAVACAKSLAEQDWLVTFGIHPNYAETGYGYIESGESLGDGGFRVARFVEKPNLATAQSYLDAGTYAWNSGMFLFKAQRYLDELARHAPSFCSQPGTRLRQPSLIWTSSGSASLSSRSAR